VLDAKVHIIKPNGKTFTVFVGFMDGRIYEVFALDHKLAGVADGQTGQIVKEKGENDLNFYHFESGAMRIQKLNSYEDNEASLFTRLVSTSLRHGVPLEFIVDQISKSRALITSFPKAIAKTLAIYIKQEELRGKFRCKKCGSDDIQMGATCKTCRNCGESLCG
jgi:ribonucleoside-diphosphate reductase alpha chain